MIPPAAGFHFETWFWNLRRSNKSQKTASSTRSTSWLGTLDFSMTLFGSRFVLHAASAAPACTSLAFLYSQNSQKMWRLLSGIEECFLLRSDWWSGLRPGLGSAPVCSGWVEKGREGGGKGWSNQPPHHHLQPSQPAAQIPESHGWKSLPAELTYLSKATSEPSWWIKSPAEWQDTAEQPPHMLRDHTSGFAPSKVWGQPPPPPSELVMFHRDYRRVWSRPRWVACNSRLHPRNPSSVHYRQSILPVFFLSRFPHCQQEVQTFFDMWATTRTCFELFHCI